MSKLNEADFLFKRLDVELLENIDSQYFSEPREFRSLIEVLGVLGEKVDQINNRGEDLLAVLKDRNLAYSRLLNQRKMVEEVIEEVVKFQHGGLNNSVDTMSEVVKEYSRGRDDIRGLRKSLNETQSVLTSKKSGQIPLKELWLKKAEVEQSLRIVKELESVKNAPHRVQRFMQQKRYLTAVVNLNKAISNMFSEDLVQVTGLVVVREQLMDLKETLLETCVSELKDIIIIGSFAELELVSKECGSDSDEGGNSDSRSERSLFFDDNRSVRSRSIANSQMLSETDGNTSSNGMLSSVPGELAEQWPLDFKDLDEALETSLVDPSTSGSVFIRLLVKTVSVLHCEEDVERLLLENMSKRFRTISINRLKDFALARLHVAQSGVGDESGGDASDSWDISVHTKLFADYVSSLLDASLLALHRLLYILKLLGLIKAQRTTGQSSESAQTLLYSQQLLEVESRAKDQNKHLLLSLWSEIEDAIIREIRIHLLEEDVENITDHLVGHSGRPTALQQSADTEEEEDGENEEELNRGVIFRPTARHAAALFRMVVSYSAAINRMMKENGLATDGVYSSSLATAERANHERTIAVLGGRPPASLTVMESLNLKAALVAVASPAVSSENKVLGFIQSFLEEELIPVIQSSANQDMREIQLNNQHFSVTIDGHGDGVQSSLRQSHLNPQRQAVCFAAELCRRTAAPLFDFWLQLSLHRNMVSTVIENVIRGFASAARDEFENLTYGLLSQSGGRSSGMKAGVVSGTVRDPLFAVYRAQVYAGKVSFEDLVVGFVDSNSIAARSGRRVSKSAVYDNSLSDNVTNQTLLGTNSNALELHCWEAFWDVGSVRYPITKDKVAKDFQALSTVASIAYGCDWLVRRISVMCNATSRKVLSQPGPPLGASPALRRPSVKSHSNSPLAPESGGTGSAKGIVRSEVVETRNTLIGGVVGGTKELSLIAEECIAMLRGELEIVCFYFLSSLAHIKLLKSDAEPLRKISLKAGSNGNMKMNGEGSYGRSRQSFVVASGDVVHTGDEVNSEEEVIVSAFAHHLSQYVDAISATCGVSSMVGVVLSPLCSLVPRILMKCAMHIVLQNAGDVRSSNTLPTQLSTSTESLLKTRLLRIVVAIQQSTSVCIQSSVVDPETKRKLQDILTEEFERLRRYVTLLDMPLSELKAYLRSHFEEFSKEEVQVLWFKTSSKLADSTFEEIWRDLEYSSAQAAVKRNSSSGSAVSFLNRK